MASFLTLNEFVDNCRDTDKVSDLWHSALDFFHERKIKMVSYHSDDAQTPGSDRLGIVTQGFPETWVRQYLEREMFKVDPIPKVSAMTSHAFKWSEVSRLTRLSDEGRNYITLLTEAAIGDGLALHVFGPRMRNAYVGLGFGLTDPQLTSEEIFELQCGAQIAHIRYCELTEDRQRPLDSLSPREMEILQWIARGKSNSVIGDILGISRHSVDTMTRRIFEKLKVHDRTTAAIRGLGSGLIRHRRGEVV